ncbi:MAG: biotin--[acetyl-CoA-carboxylase] ligase [Muribaculaceae bacterium]
MNIIEIQQTDSTNSWVARNSDGLEPPCLIYAAEQTAGRGQRGNYWESEPGMNLTASAFLHPAGVKPREQFVISEAIALAVVDFLSKLGVEATVKWPNDIYAGDKKICGILIEHSIFGREITRTIAGIGVNINQTDFVSNAPNPVSVKQITGKEHFIPEMASMLGDAVEIRMAQTAMPDKLHDEFMHSLWRGDGAMYTFFDRIANERIEARIKSIAPDGILSLETTGGDVRNYAFKEVEFIL